MFLPKQEGPFSATCTTAQPQALRRASAWARGKAEATSQGGQRPSTGGMVDLTWHLAYMLLSEHISNKTDMLENF